MFTSGQEEQAIRDAVRGIVDSFGPDYYQQQVDDGVNCAELWDALGAKGYLGVHLPEKYGGGGLGLRELAIVV
jgi:alkylation response protein AidB-like acyl-CoA dehydrogenase